MQTDICSFFFVKASSGGLFYLLFFPNLKGVKVLKLPLLVGLILLEKKGWYCFSFCCGPPLHPSSPRNIQLVHFHIYKQGKREIWKYIILLWSECSSRRNIRIDDRHQNQLTWFSCLNFLEPWTINLLVIMQLFAW